MAQVDDGPDLHAIAAAALVMLTAPWLSERALARIELERHFGIGDPKEHAELEARFKKEIAEREALFARTRAAQAAGVEAQASTPTPPRVEPERPKRTPKPLPPLPLGTLL